MKKIVFFIPEYLLCNNCISFKLNKDLLDEISKKTGISKKIVKKSFLPFKNKTVSGGRKKTRKTRKAGALTDDQKHRMTDAIVLLLGTASLITLPAAASRALVASGFMQEKCKQSIVTWAGMYWASVKTGGAVKDCQAILQEWDNLAQWIVGTLGPLGIWNRATLRLYYSDVHNYVYSLLFGTSNDQDQASRAINQIMSAQGIPGVVVNPAILQNYMQQAVIANNNAMLQAGLLTPDQVAQWRQMATALPQVATPAAPTPAAPAAPIRATASRGRARNAPASQTVPDLSNMVADLGIPGTAPGSWGATLVSAVDPATGPLTASSTQPDEGAVADSKSKSSKEGKMSAEEKRRADEEERQEAMMRHNAYDDDSPPYHPSSPQEKRASKRRGRGLRKRKRSRQRR